MPTNKLNERLVRHIKMNWKNSCVFARSPTISYSHIVKMSRFNVHSVLVIESLLRLGCKNLVTYLIYSYILRT